MASQKKVRARIRDFNRDTEWRKEKNGQDWDDPGIAGLTDERPSTGKRRAGHRRKARAKRHKHL